MLDTFGSFSAIFYKADNFCDNRSPFRVDPFSNMGGCGQKYDDRVALSESISISPYFFLIFS